MANVVVMNFAFDWGQFAARPPLYGLHDLDVATRNGVSRSLMPEDSTLWARLAIGQRRSTIRLTPRCGWRDQHQSCPEAPFWRPGE